MNKLKYLGIGMLLILTGCQKAEAKLPQIQVGLIESKEEEKIVYDEPILTIYQAEQIVLEGILLEKEGYEALKESLDQSNKSENQTYFIDIHANLGGVFRSGEGEEEGQRIVDRLYFE